MGRSCTCCVFPQLHSGYDLSTFRNISQFTPTITHDMPNKKKKSSKKPKTQHNPSGNPSGTQRSRASASSHSGPSTTTTGQSTQAGGSSTGGPSTAATYKGLRFPANGSAPHRIDYTTTKPTQRPDSWLGIAADFSPYWNGDYQTRKMQRLCVSQNSLPALDGDYNIYYSRNPDLPVNEAIRSIPVVRATIDRSIERGEKFEERLFWRGDVLVARMGESFEKDFNAKYDDISPQLVQPLIELLARGFASDWEDKFVEYQERLEADFEEHDRKSKIMKQKIITEWGLYVHLGMTTSEV